MATIVDIYGNPLRTQQLRKQQTAHLTGLAKEFANHPAKGLTPAKLARILIEAEQGQLQAQAELFMDMEERDAHLFAEMSKRKRAVLGLDWTIEPPRNASAAEKADAEYLHELLLDLEGIEDLMLDCMDGVGHGYSAIELDWSLQGREWLPQAFDHRPQSWFQLSPDDQDELRLRDNSIAGEVLQPFGWIMHKPRSRSGYVARSGLFRVLAWPYLFKHYSTADLAEMLEIYGLPIRLGKYPPGTPDEEKVTLLRAVTGLGHAAAGIIPESMSIEFQEASKGSAEPFMAMMRWCDDSMSKAILGGTLTSQTSESGGGAYALGQVHNEVRHDLLAADARQLAATLSRDLLWPLLVLNRSGNLDARRAPPPGVRPQGPGRPGRHGNVITAPGQVGRPGSGQLGPGATGNPAAGQGRGSPGRSGRRRHRPTEPAPWSSRRCAGPGDWTTLPRSGSAGPGAGQPASPGHAKPGR